MIMRRSTFFQFAVELTNRCQFSCAHCFRCNNHADAPDFPLPLYEKVLKGAQSYRAGYVVLTGGEPTLHPEFEAVLALTAQYGFRCTLVTNGWTFERMYPLLLRYRDHVHAVVFSLDGAAKQTHDTIRRQPGSHTRVLRACMTCYYTHLPFSLSMAVQRANVEEITGLINLASKLGAEEVNVACAQLTQELVSQDLALSPQERKQLQPKLLALQASSSLPVNVLFDMYLENPFFPCQTLCMATLHFDHRGQAIFCGQLPSSLSDREDSAILGHIGNSSLWDCHRNLLRKIAEFQQVKLQRVEQQDLTDNEFFPCYYCAHYFHRLDWLKDFPLSAWNP